MSPPLKETDYLKAWVLFFLCATVAGAVAGAVVGGILGAVLAAAQVPLDTLKLVCGVAGLIVGLPISYGFFRLFVSRFIVRKLTTPDAPERDAYGS